MKSTNVLLTGATGFLGSHVAEALLYAGYKLISTYRTNSDLWRCESFKHRITWVNTDDYNWVQTVVKAEPQIIIHSAWSGVTANDRLNWQAQLNNLRITSELLYIAKEVKAKTFVGFGSQAEYGTFDGRISEEHPTNPNTAYGTVKLMAYELIKGFFESLHDESANWYWLRLFSFFGEKEDAQWLIPSTIQNLSQQQVVDFTPGEQKYAYLYVKDLTDMLMQVIKSEALSGVYNVSSTHPIPIKHLIQTIHRLLDSQSQLNFGSIPYRVGQSMHIEGDMTKFDKFIGTFEESNFETCLLKTVESYRKTNE